MSSNLKKANRELLEDFIREYQNQPCLWRIKSKEYHDKAKKDAAFDVLLKKYRLIDHNADTDAVVKKINAFRTNFRRKKKKVDGSIHFGMGTEEAYKPTLWYYHLFEFLGDQETPRSSSSNLNEKEEEAGEQPTEDSVEDLDEYNRETEVTHSTARGTSTSSEDMPIQPTPKKKRPLLDPLKEVMINAILC